jgi:hypothetical protein
MPGHVFYETVRNYLAFAVLGNKLFCIIYFAPFYPIIYTTFVSTSSSLRFGKFIIYNFCNGNLCKQNNNWCGVWLAYLACKT